MSQPPKSTMRAPAARWTALSGVCLQHALLPAEREKGEAVVPLRPVCPFYLRDCGAMQRSRRCPFGGPPSPRAAALQIDLLSAQSSLPERFRELRLRRRRRLEAGAALSCTDDAKVTGRPRALSKARTRPVRPARRAAVARLQHGCEYLLLEREDVGDHRLQVGIAAPAGSAASAPGPRRPSRPSSPSP